MIYCFRGNIFSYVSFSGCYITNELNKQQLGWLWQRYKNLHTKKLWWCQIWMKHQTVCKHNFWKKYQKLPMFIVMTTVDVCQNRDLANLLTLLLQPCPPVFSLFIELQKKWEWNYWIEETVRDSIGYVRLYHGSTLSVILLLLNTISSGLNSAISMEAQWVCKPDRHLLCVLPDTF